MPSFSIAIIEDDDKIRHYLAEQIQTHITVTELKEFANGESALQQLTVHPVDIALFDVQLPGHEWYRMYPEVKDHSSPDANDGAYRV
jgi:DNA-binding NarL/FixJ family response regulator